MAITDYNTSRDGNHVIDGVQLDSSAWALSFAVRSMMADLAGYNEVLSGTMTISDATSGGNDSATSANYRGYRVGDWVTLTVWATNVSTVGMTGANILFLLSLPYAAHASAQPRRVGSGVSEDITATEVKPLLTAGETYLAICKAARTAAASELRVSDLTSGSADFTLHFSYLTT